MRLLIHQVVKDARLIRWLALAWVVLVMLLQGITVRMALVPAGQDAAFARLAYGYTVIQALLVGLFAVIAVVVVQSDAALGTTAFWFTRPISVPVLLASKFVVSVILLMVVPIAADAIAMTIGGLSAADALSTIPVSLATQAAWLLPLLALAAITANLAQFACAVLAEVLIFVASVFAFGGLITRPRRLVSISAPPSTDVLLLVLAVGLAAFGLLALGSAYRTRTLRRPATLTVIAPVALAALLFGWPFSFASWPDARPLSQVTATAIPGTLRLVGGYQGNWTLTAGFRFSSVPPRVSLSVVGVRAWIDYPDGRVNLDAEPTAFATNRQAAGGELRALADAVGAPRLNDPQSAQQSAGGFRADLPKGVYDRRRNQTGVLHAEIRVLVNEKKAVIVAVRAGERYRTEGRAGEIIDVSEAPDALSVQVHDMSIKPLAAGAPGTDAVSVTYALRNPRLGVASLPSGSRGTANLPPYQAPIPAPAHLAASWITCKFPWPDDVSSSDWLAGAELVVVESRMVGYATLHATGSIEMLSSLTHPPPPMPR